MRIRVDPDTPGSSESSARARGKLGNEAVCDLPLKCFKHHIAARGAALKRDDRRTRPSSRVSQSGDVSFSLRRRRTAGFVGTSTARPPLALGKIVNALHDARGAASRPAPSLASPSCTTSARERVPDAAVRADARRLESDHAAPAPDPRAKCASPGSGIARALPRPSRLHRTPLVLGRPALLGLARRRRLVRPGASRASAQNTNRAPSPLNFPPTSRHLNLRRSRSGAGRWDPARLEAGRGGPYKRRPGP